MGAQSTTALLDRLGEQFPNFCAALQAGQGDPIEEVVSPATPDKIAGVETELGVPLPESYRAFMKCSAGFWLLGGCVKFHEPFFHEFPPLEKLTPAQRQIVNARGGIWPPPSEGMLCFADFFWKADGNQVLFDVSSGLVGGEYPVIYYDHESHPPTAERIANSFADWIEGCLSVFAEEE